jgi:hypothetical protein
MKLGSSGLEVVLPSKGEIREKELLFRGGERLDAPAWRLTSDRVIGGGVAGGPRMAPASLLRTASR